MPENVQNILNKINDWWKKFSVKQKTLLVSITAVIVLALVILAVVMNQPNMVTLVTCENAKQASQVISLQTAMGLKMCLMVV